MGFDDWVKLGMVGSQVVKDAKAGMFERDVDDLMQRHSGGYGPQERPDDVSPKVWDEAARRHGRAQSAQLEQTAQRLGYDAAKLRHEMTQLTRQRDDAVRKVILSDGDPQVVAQVASEIFPDDYRYEAVRGEGEAFTLRPYRQGEDGAKQYVKGGDIRFAGPGDAVQKAAAMRSPEGFRSWLNARFGTAKEKDPLIRDVGGSLVNIVSDGAGGMRAVPIPGAQAPREDKPPKIYTVGGSLYTVQPGEDGPRAVPVKGGQKPAPPQPKTAESPGGVWIMPDGSTVSSWVDFKRAWDAIANTGQKDVWGNPVTVAASPENMKRFGIRFLPDSMRGKGLEPQLQDPGISGGSMVRAKVRKPQDGTPQQATPMPVREQPPAQQERPQQGRGYGLRVDGTPKGQGFLGELERPGGGISTELSVGVEFDGKEHEIPLLVPTLSREEVDLLLRGDKATPQILQKAVRHARKRIAAGMSPFAQDGEGLTMSQAGGADFVFNPSTGTFE